jgi:hypothetical protein
MARNSVGFRRGWAAKPQLEKASPDRTDVIFFMD